MTKPISPEATKPCGSPRASASDFLHSGPGPWAATAFRNRSLLVLGDSNLRLLAWHLLVYNHADVPQQAMKDNLLHQPGWVFADALLCGRHGSGCWNCSVCCHPLNQRTRSDGRLINLSTNKTCPGGPHRPWCQCAVSPWILGGVAHAAANCDARLQLEIRARQ